MKKELEEKSIDALIREELDNLDESTNEQPTDEIESEIDMMMRPSDDKLTHDEIQDIANSYGVDFEDVVNVMQSYINNREKVRQNDFNTAIRELFIDTDNLNLTTDEMWDSWIKNGYEEEMPWITKNEFIKGTKKLLSNPNQLSLFNESQIRKAIRSIIVEISNEDGLGTLSDLTGVDMTNLIPYSDLLVAVARNLGWSHELTEQISYAIEIKDQKERESRIIALLKDYDVYDEFFHFLGMNEGNNLKELYPLMVGEDNVQKKNSKKTSFSVGVRNQGKN